MFDYANKKQTISEPCSHYRDLQKSYANHIRTAFKPMTNLSCTSAARGDGASPGWNIRRRINVPVTSFSMARMNRRTTLWLWSRPGHAERRHTISRTWSSLVPAAGYILVSTLAPCGRASAESALLAAPRMATGGPGRGLSKPDLLKLARRLAFYFLTRAINRQVGLHLV